MGDAAGYEDALTGEGVSLAVKQARAAVDAIVGDGPASYEAAWHRVTRNYRLLTRATGVGHHATADAPRRRAGWSSCCPPRSGYGVNILAHSSSAQF